MSISSANTGMYSIGSGSSTYAAWLSSPSAVSGNGFLANSTGTYLQSATDLVLTGTAISVTGATQINTTGSYSTSVGNTIGVVTIVGSAVNVGTNSGSSVNLGSSAGNSTVSLNGNRLQNVGAGVLGTDAVNLNQLNSLLSSTTSQIANLQSQVNTNKNGIAGVSAMSNIPSLSSSQKNNFGVGIGAFQGASAIAFGGNFRIKDNLVGKISASLSSGNYVTGAGLSIGW
jgi:autotransporter adhesin